MEYLLLLVALILLFSVIFIREAIMARQSEKAFIQSLRDHYGEMNRKEYSKERYDNISAYYRKHRRAGQIDDITWNDLSMDDIFKRMNYTFSASGEEYLYYTLRSTDTDRETLEHLEEVVTFFSEHEEERVQIQYLMHQLGYTGKYSLYDYLDNLDFLGTRSNKKHIMADVLLLPFIGVCFLNLPVGLAGIAGILCYNVTTYFKEKSVVDPYITSFAYVIRLMEQCEKITEVKVPVCDKEWCGAKEKLNRLNAVRRGSFFVMSGNKGLTSGNPLDILADYLRMSLHVDIIQFNNMLSRLRSHMKEVDGLIEFVGALETAIAIGAFRESLTEYCIPQFSGSGIRVIKGYHPLLTRPVANSIETDTNVLLTGSNASGKSTFLKMMAINVIFAQSIHTVCASSYRAPIYHIYSSMALHDNIQSGESYYIVEIKALKRILDAVKEGERVLCFVDEILRGTNTVERIAAASQILKSLSTDRILCFAATHDIELTSILEKSFKNYHFEEEIVEGDIHFPYLLLQGPATSRNAIKLLEIMGYDQKVIAQAYEQAERFIETGNWLQA